MASGGMGSSGMGSSGAGGGNGGGGPFAAHMGRDGHMSARMRRDSVVDIDDESYYSEDAAEVLHQQRMLKRDAKQKDLEWENRTFNQAHASRLELITRFFAYRVLGRWKVLYLCLTLLWLIITLIFFGLWGMFWVFDDQDIASKYLHGLFRGLAFSILAVGVIFFVLLMVNSCVDRILQTRLLLGPNRMVLSLTVLCVGIVMFSSFRPLALNEIKWECDDDEDEVTTVMVGNMTAVETTSTSSSDDDSLFADVCISWRWFCLSLMVTGVLWFTRNVIEEVILYRAGIRLDSKNLSLATIRELALAIVARASRRAGIIKVRRDPENELPDLYLHIRSLRQDELLNALQRAAHENGEFREGVTSKRKNAIRDEVKRQSTLIFRYLDKRGTGYLTQDNFHDLPGELNSKSLFTVFDRMCQERISLEQFVLVVDEVYFSRQRVWDSYNDRRKIVGLLRFCIGIVFWAFILVLWIVFAGVSVTAVLLPAASLLLGFSFAFGSLVQVIVESFVLMLFVRPFDVGDKVNIPDTGGTLFVYEMGLFRTLFWAADNRLISLPNRELINSRITNVFRSRTYTFGTELVFSHDTPGNTILEFKRQCEEYLRSQADTFLYEECIVYVDKIEDTNKVRLGFWLPMNDVLWRSWVEFTPIKTELFLFFHKAARNLGIRYELPAQPFITTDQVSGRRRASSRGSSAGSARNIHARDSEVYGEM